MYKIGKCEFIRSNATLFVTVDPKFINMCCTLGGGQKMNDSFIHIMPEGWLDQGSKHLLVDPDKI